MTRSPEAQQLALELGAASAGDADAAPPEPLDSAILFAPVGTLVPPALAALDRGGTLAIAGIYLSDIPALNYERALFEERTLRSVTANTRHDGEEFLAEAARIRLRLGHRPTRWTAPTTRCATCATTGSTAPPSSSPEASGGRRPRGSGPSDDTASATRSADGAPVDSRQSAVTGPLAIGPGALDWGTHAGSAIRR